jgi:hypothetical protein
MVVHVPPKNNLPRVAPNPRYGLVLLLAVQTIVALLLCLPLAVMAGCPFGFDTAAKETASTLSTPRLSYPAPSSDYAAAVAALDWAAVKADIIHLLTDSKPFWPADFGNYGVWVPLHTKTIHCFLL